MELLWESAFRLAVFLLCDTFFTFTCVHLQPVDPGEVFQDAAGEGDDQVDVDVGVVFNASVTKGEQTLVYASSSSFCYARNSVTKGEQTLVYASSYPTLYARNGCLWTAWLSKYCFLFDAFVRHSAWHLILSRLNAFFDILVFHLT